jgi:hypothetical protein
MKVPESSTVFHSGAAFGSTPFGTSTSVSKRLSLR